MAPYFLNLSQVLAKLTSKNQLTLPKSVTEPLGPVQYFEVQTKAGQIILTPVKIQRGDAVRAKLAELAIDEKTIESALSWAEGAKKVLVKKTAAKPALKKTVAKKAASPKAAAKPLSAKTAPKTVPRAAGKLAEKTATVAVKKTLSSSSPSPSKKTVADSVKKKTVLSSPKASSSPASKRQPALQQ
ncbi:hypothetical protein [Paucibacter sp. Y2R2-4]|uniref:hypothetical protein n=1 Tax=Paucibacter sp. Y2R2-4 TaxID=2893553 RepID=UPI0021E3E8E2|nr:hypothetical protein [Paucibacter sp. Y2R2-4]MCV2350354.1 hypothetical protein [Paucibacter sp. Y2R2-4]